MTSTLLTTDTGKTTDTDGSSKQDKKKVRIDVPQDDGGFNISFRLSKAYRALEKQEHVASRPSIKPYRRSRTSTGNIKDPLQKELDAYGDNAHAFLWTDPAQKKRQTDVAMDSLWNMLSQDRAKRAEERREEERQKKLTQEKRKQELAKRKTELSPETYLKALNKSMPLTRPSADRNRRVSTVSYFSGVKNVAIGHNKAMAPFRISRETKENKEKDPEKAERMRLARERLKANSKYAGFWRKLKDNDKPEKKEGGEKRQKPKMAWCAADNSFMVQEWQEKKKRAEEQAKEKWKRRAGTHRQVTNVLHNIPEKNSRTSSLEKLSARSGPVRSTTPLRMAPKETEISEDDKETNLLFKTIMEQKSANNTPSPSTGTKSKTMEKKKVKRSQVADSGLITEEAEEAMGEEEETEEKSKKGKGKNGEDFADLLGSSSSDSNSSKGMTSSASSALKVLTTKPKGKADGEKPETEPSRPPEQAPSSKEPEIEVVPLSARGKTPVEHKVISRQSTRLELRPPPGSKDGRQKSSRPVKTCRYLYQLCDCKKISKQQTLAKLQDRRKVRSETDQDNRSRDSKMNYYHIPCAY